MRVSKWGNSLAVRIPAGIVEEMGLKEGDEVEFRRKGSNLVEIVSANKNSALRERLKSFRGKIPDDFTFAREETHERD